MKYARIKDSENNILQDANGDIIRILAKKFKTKEDARKFLEKLENTTGKTDLQFCCSHGECKSPVYFRKESPKVAGKRNRARNQTWVSKDVDDHITNCLGPSEIDFDNIPHNTLTLTDAILTEGEVILFHIDIELGKAAKKSFAKAAKSETEDVKWRKENTSSHSYFAVNDVDYLLKSIALIAKKGQREALLRTKVAHEGKLKSLRQFIVRNNAEDRMKIIEGDHRVTGLRYRGELMARHSTKSSFGQSWVYGEPRLVMFEAAQSYHLSKHPDGKNVARGHRYDVIDGRRVFDQLHFNGSNIHPNQFYPNGGMVLAIPFIHPDQSKKHPIIHWSIKSVDQVSFTPPQEVLKLLCWNGQNIPSDNIPPNKDPRQKTMDLHP